MEGKPTLKKVFLLTLGVAFGFVTLLPAVHAEFSFVDNNACPKCRWQKNLVVHMTPTEKVPTAYATDKATLKTYYAELRRRTHSDDLASASPEVQAAALECGSHGGLFAQEQANCVFEKEEFLPACPSGGGDMGENNGPCAQLQVKCHVNTYCYQCW